MGAVMNTLRRADLALLVSRAMGNANHDTIELRNQWAHVTITREDNEHCVTYVLTGDLCHKAARDFVYAPRREFPLLVDALLYALQSLAHYQAGALR
jgi:hypothetical protein